MTEINRGYHETFKVGERVAIEKKQPMVSKWVASLYKSGL